MEMTLNQSPAGDSPKHSAKHLQKSKWQAVHSELLHFGKARAGQDYREGQLLLMALRSGVHAKLGYGTFNEYVGRFLGYSPRLTIDKLRVAQALEYLPELGTALQSGELHWSAVRELTRVATPETEAAWLVHARGRSVREIEKLVSGHAMGDLPNDPSDPSSRLYVLRFEVRGETLALFREALAKLRRDSGEPIDDDSALLLMARAVLEGPTDQGRASYQVHLSICQACGRGEVRGKGESISVDPAVMDMCQCDAQVVRDTHVGTPNTPPTHVGAPNTPPTHVGTPSAAPTHVGTSPVKPPSKRAVQTIPPALRRYVMQRDHGRCVVPGCHNATFLDVHHILSREAGGQHEADNLCCLCGGHHRAIHTGALAVEGRPSTGLLFRHADGTPYGEESALITLT